MRQLTLNTDLKVEWQEVARPSLSGPRAAIVRPVAVATCDFDHLMVSGSMSMQLPIPIGHEFVAEVVEVGGEVTKVRAGDLVVVPFQISCGECPACLRGHTNSCETLHSFSCYGLGQIAGNFGGAMSDLVEVPFADAMLVGLPPGVSPADAAACSCNVTDAYRCVGPQLLERPGVRVLIVNGAFGNIGLYCVLIAIAMGAAGVDFVDKDPSRAAIAARLGANLLSADMVKSASYPITVDTSMDVDLLAIALQATAPSGECTVSTMYREGLTAIPLWEMFRNSVTLRTGMPHIRAHLVAVLEMVAAGVLDLRAITSAVVDWEAAPAAFTSGHGKTVCVR